MNFKTFTASLLTLLTISTPVIAIPNWKVFGKSNGGSEIALDTNSFNQSANTVYFVYRIIKNGETFYHKGKTNDCFVGDSGQTSGHPQLWQSIDNPSNPVNVYADSPASQNMLINVCRYAHPVVSRSISKRRRDVNSRESGVDIFNGKILAGTNCYSAVIQQRNNIMVSCTKVTYQISSNSPNETIIYFVNEANNTGVQYRVNNTPSYHNGNAHYELVGYKIINGIFPDSDLDLNGGSCWIDKNKNVLACVATESDSAGGARNIASKSN